MAKPTTIRTPLSKTLRFEVFRRDGFVCQYCGRRPPEAVLEVDYITPVAKGGTNDVLNLVTACFDCNRGKRDEDLGERKVYPDADVEFLAMQQELAELQRYQSAKTKRDELIAAIIAGLQDLWCDTFDDTYCPVDSQFRTWLNFSSPEIVESAVLAAGCKARELYAMGNRLRYVGAIIRNKVNAERGVDV